MEKQRVVKRRPTSTSKDDLESSLSVSPPQRKKAGRSSQRPKRKEKREEYWRLDEPAVLDEQQREDGRYLLLNWADIDSATGKKYAPTWERDSQAAITSWNEVPKKETEQETGSDEEEVQTAGIRDIQEPGRPTTKKRLVRRSDIVYREKRRRVGTNATATGVFTTEGSVEREIHDTYEEEQPSLNRQSGPELWVEIPVPENFDRSLYAVAPASRQSSPLVEDSQDVGKSIRSQNSGPRRRPTYIWDEDKVVPDSEQLGSSSYKASSSAHTRNSLPRDFGAESISRRSFNSIGLRATQSAAGNIRPQSVSDSLAETQSFLGQASFQLPEASRNVNQSSENIPFSTAQSKRFSDGESQDNRFLPSRKLGASLPNSATRVSHNTVSSQSSYHQDIRQKSNNPNSVYPGSQLSSQYLTQLPVSPSPLFGSLNLPHTNPLEDQSQQLRRLSGSTNSRPDRDTQRSNSLVRSLISQTQQSPPASQAAPSSFEATWAAAKVISSAHERTRLSGNSASTLSSQSKPPSASRGLSRSVEQFHVDLGNNNQKSQLVADGSNSQSKRSEAYHSQSSHLPSPPSEDILPIIEDPFGNNSPASARNATTPSSDAIGASSPNRPMSASSNMNPAVKQEEAPYDVKSAIKQAMEAKRMQIREEQRERDRTLSTASPSPAIFVPETVVAVDLKNRPLVPTIVEDAAIANALNLTARENNPASDVEPSTSMDVLPTKSNEFLVPLPMISLVRNVYNTEIHDHKNVIKMFTRGDPASCDEEKIEKVDSLLGGLRKICDHQDTFNDGSSTQQSSTPTPMNTDEQAQWAENCSTKCIFLVSFLVRFKSQREHIVIVARPGMIHVLQEICKYHGINYNFASPNEGSSSLRITLHPIGEQRAPIIPPTIVIAFGCDPEDFHLLRDIRSNTDAPLISLIIYHSIEHLDRRFTEEMDPSRRRMRLVKCLRKLEGTMGHMRDHPFEEPAVAANAVAEYFENGALPDSWPLPPIPEIEGIEMTPDSQLNSSQDPSFGVANGSLDPPEVVFQPGLKRQIEDITDIGSPKRQRLTPTPGDTVLDMEISHVSDCVQQSSASHRHVAVSQSSGAASQSSSTGRVSSLLNKIKNLENQLQEKAADEARLRQLNNELEAGRKDLMESIERITPKYQEALNDRGQFEHDLTQARIREAAANKRVAAQAAEITKLKEKNAATQEELSETRQALSASTIPGLVEVGKLKEDVAKLKADNERLQKGALSLQNQAEYMRTNYQNASTAAAEATAESQELQAANAELKAKVDANKVRIHELQRDSDLSTHISTIKRLRSENDDLQRECERRGEALRTFTSKRVSGRHTPGSPRIGGAMSPRNVGRNFRADSAGGSRGNSPAPGELFGGNLDASAVRGGSVRWGTHLQQ